MDLPPFPNITEEAIYAIIEAHSLQVETFRRLPQIGIVNKIYQLDDNFILRVSREHPKSLTIAQTEATVVPLARMAGVRTPELVVCDTSLNIVSAPYTIYECVRGETLGLLDLEPDRTPNVWREVGRDLALLHSSSLATEEDLELVWEDIPDPRQWPNELAQAGYFTSIEAEWFNRWLEHLASAALQPVQKRLQHGDVQATNIIVNAGSYDYLALIDWGNAHWGDPVHDFGDKPIRTVPYVLEGYREIAPLERDETIEARILWRHLQLALHNMGREPLPNNSWAERPMSFWIDIVRLLLETNDEKWKQWVVI